MISQHTHTCKHPLCPYPAQQCLVLGGAPTHSDPANNNTPFLMRAVTDELLTFVQLTVLQLTPLSAPNKQVLALSMLAVGGAAPTNFSDLNHQ